MSGQDPARKPDAAALERELNTLRTEQDQALQEFDRRLTELAGRSSGDAAGTSRFLISGYGFSGFTDRERDNSSFEAGFNPIFLWKIRDDILFEAELGFELAAHETEVGLEYAQLSYLVNDYVTLGVGKFFNPGNYFVERLHPAWINKLPDAPLAFGHGGLIAPSHVGMQVHGGVPVGGRKFEYAVWLSNGPTLVTDDPDEAGSLEFGNRDTNNAKTVGGRLGLFALPQLEFGYSVEFGRVDPTDTMPNDVDSLIQSVDANWTGECDALQGTFDIRAQWVWSRVDDATYDAAGGMGFGPLNYRNRRSGGYAQAAFRPTKLDSGLRDVEVIARYDAIDAPSGSPEPVDRRRWTLGFDYWLDASTALKVAYQFDDRSDPTGTARDANAVFVQMAIGF